MALRHVGVTTTVATRSSSFDPPPSEVPRRLGKKAEAEQRRNPREEEGRGTRTRTTRLDEEVAALETPGAYSKVRSLPILPQVLNLGSMMNG